MSAHPDVVVVGAGVIGAAAALELAGAGLKVHLVDRGRPGGEASGASAGLLSAFSLSRSGDQARLARLSRDLHGPLAERLREEAGVDVEHQEGGHLDLAVTDEQAQASRRLAADPGGGADGLAWIDALELRRLEPAVSPQARGALSLPRNGWVNNERLVTALVRAAALRGVTVTLDEAIEGLSREGDRVTGVRTRQRAISAGTVVLAAGAWSGRISGAPAELVTRPVKGQMLALAHLPPVLRRVILFEHIYLVPRASGECLVGATVEDGPEDKAVTAAGLHWLLAEAMRAVPGLAACPVARTWAGLRPATPDGLPVVGPWPGRPGLVVATGHFRSGVLLAPVTAHLVRDLVVRGRTDLPASSWSPRRLVG